MWAHTIKGKRKKLITCRAKSFAAKNTSTKPRDKELDAAPERPRHGGVLGLEEAVGQPVPVLVEAVVFLLLDPDLSLVNQPGRSLIIIIIVMDNFP